MDQILHINAGRVSVFRHCPDDQCQLHCLNGFRFSYGNLKYIKQMTFNASPPRRVGDVFALK